MDCLSDNCEVGEETTGTCQPLPEAGESCTFRCAGDLRCGFDQDDYRCSPRLSAGESCDVDEDCTSGHCAGEPGQSTCSGRPASGPSRWMAPVPNSVDVTP